MDNMALDNRELDRNTAILSVVGTRSALVTRIVELLLQTIENGDMAQLIMSCALMAESAMLAVDRGAELPIPHTIAGQLDANRVMGVDVALLAKEEGEMLTAEMIAGSDRLMNRLLEIGDRRRAGAWKTLIDSRGELEKGILEGEDGGGS